MKKVFVSLLICSVLIARPQTMGPNSSIYPEEVLEDLEILFTTLKESHPDLYGYSTKDRIEFLMDSINNVVKLPKNEIEVLDVLQKLFLEISDPNLALLPSDETRARTYESAMMLPFKVKIFEEGIYVLDELKGHQSIPPGSRVFFINGKSDDEIMATLMDNIPAEGENLTFKYRWIDQRFPELYYRYIDQSDRYNVMYEDPEGDLHSCDMHGLTPAEMDLTSDAGITSKEITYGFNEVSASGYLRVPTFDPTVNKAQGQNADKEYRAFFNEVKKRDYKMVVIDLRGNDGGTSYHAEQLYACFAEGRFRADRDIWIASTAKPSYYDHTSQPEKFYKDLNNDYKKNLAGTYSINSDHFALNFAEPKKEAFAGRVYILVDGATRNSGVIPAVLGKDRGRVILIGEESGANVASTTGGQRLDLTLPNTGIQVQIPLQKILYDVDLDQERDHGLIVDQHIEQHPYDLAKGKDSVYEAVNRLLMEYR